MWTRTSVEILDGRPPANTSPVRLDGIPGLTHRYSGGGYVVLQRLLEDVTGTAYADLAAELVLTPAGMTTAGFTAPDPPKAAVAHVAGIPVPGSRTGHRLRGPWGAFTTPHGP